MVDRLSDFKYGLKCDHTLIGIDQSSLFSSAPSTERGSDQKAAMQDFFSQIDSIKGNISFIHASTTQVGLMKEKVIFSTTSEQSRGESKELEDLINDTNKKAIATKRLLAALKREVDNDKECSASNRSELRIRKNVVDTFTRKFIVVINEYQEAQSKYSDEIKRKTRARILISNPSATSESIEAALKSGVLSEHLMKVAILKDNSSSDVKNMFENVASKSRDVLILEHSVAELYRMFLDFSLVVGEQGDALDNIESNVKRANSFIGDGHNDLEIVKDLQGKMRRRNCCIVTTCFLIIIVIIIIVLIFQFLQGSLKLK